MTTYTREIILKKTKKLFARNGYEGFSIRILANVSDVGLSSIYHFFKDKDVLLKEVFDKTNTQLGIERAKLSIPDTASQMLYERIIFQFKYIEDIVFVLKYYLHFRKNFKRLQDGYVPTKAYLHIEEVLRAGVKSGEFTIDEADIEKEAKVITHAINGYLLEYYPDRPKKSEIDEVVAPIHKFLMRSLTNKEVNMQQTRV